MVGKPVWLYDAARCGIPPAATLGRAQPGRQRLRARRTGTVAVHAVGSRGLTRPCGSNASSARPHSMGSVPVAYDAVCGHQQWPTATAATSATKSARTTTEPASPAKSVRSCVVSMVTSLLRDT